MAFPPLQPNHKQLRINRGGYSLSLSLCLCLSLPRISPLNITHSPTLSLTYSQVPYRFFSLGSHIPHLAESLLPPSPPLGETFDDLLREDGDDGSWSNPHEGGGSCCCCCCCAGLGGGAAVVGTVGVCWDGLDACDVAGVVWGGLDGVVGVCRADLAVVVAWVCGAGRWEGDAACWCDGLGAEVGVCWDVLDEGVTVVC